jgi:hypothetical protein
MKKEEQLKYYKKAQTQISFGVIFSIILIIVFIAFAIYGISKFLSVNKLAQIEKFKSDFQTDINKMWASTQGSQSMEYFIPNKIQQVCFADGEFENMYFVPVSSDYKGALLKNINIQETVKNSKATPKQLCIESSKGKISMTIKKAYNENLVTITK